MTQHTRYPLCEGSLDRIIGIVHIKDFVGTDPQSIDLRDIARPPKRVPETMPVSRLLRHFQATHQLMAIVIDEHGSMVGIVTLENVLEAIVGPVEDEFDNEPQQIVPETKGQFLIRGKAPIDLINRMLHLELDAENVDTFSGLLMTKLGDIPQRGDRVELGGATAEVLEVRGAQSDTGARDRSRRLGRVGRISLIHPFAAVFHPLSDRGLHTMAGLQECRHLSVLPARKCAASDWPIRS